MEVSDSPAGEAIHLNENQGYFEIDSEDFGLIGESVEINFSVARQDGEDLNFFISPFHARVSFHGPEPALEMDDFQIDPLTCSIADAAWSLKLPSMKYSDQHDY